MEDAMSEMQIKLLMNSCDQLEYKRSSSSKSMEWQSGWKKMERNGTLGEAKQIQFLTKSFKAPFFSFAMMYPCEMNDGNVEQKRGEWRRSILFHYADEIKCV